MILRAAAIVYVFFDLVGLILRQTFTYSRPTCRSTGKRELFRVPFHLQLASVLQAASACLLGARVVCEIEKTQQCTY